MEIILPRACTKVARACSSSTRRRRRRDAHRRRHARPVLQANLRDPDIGMAFPPALPLPWRSFPPNARHICPYPRSGGKRRRNPAVEESAAGIQSSAINTMLTM